MPDGISAKVVFGSPVFVMLEKKTTVDRPMQSAKSRVLPIGFFGIVGGIVAMPTRGKAVHTRLQPAD